MAVGSQATDGAEHALFGWVRHEPALKRLKAVGQWSVDGAALPQFVERVGGSLSNEPAFEFGENGRHLGHRPALRGAEVEPVANAD
jgi:hypothetical protein